ncbi:MAG: hypothetical protein H5U02_00560 [Clostridia bacterium]|nr:hypothetical protein [Clostridia bacterium]
MALLVKDDAGLPKPQYEREDGTAFEPLRGADGAMYIRIKDGFDAALGATASIESASGDGTLIGIAKNLRTRLADVQSGVGRPSDAAAPGTTDGSIIALLKQVRAILTDVWDPINQVIRANKKPIEIITHDYINVRDTAAYNSGAINVTGIAGRKYFRVLNGCDQELTLRLYVYSQTDLEGPVYEVKIPASTSTLVTVTQMPVLAEPLTQVEVQVRYSVAPTSGTVKVQLCGLPG